MEAAFSQSQNTQPSNIPKISNPPATQGSVANKILLDNFASVTKESEVTAVAEESDLTVAITPEFRENQKVNTKPKNIKYLILSFAAALGLGFVGYKSFFSKSVISFIECFGQ